MLRYYLKIATRSLGKQKALSFINIFGLSIGLACFFLLLLFTVHEFNFDNFHKNGDKIYRVYTWDNQAGSASTSHPMPLGPAMKQDLPGVIDYVRIRDAWQESFTRVDGKTGQAKISFADPEYFSMFSFRFIEGDPSTALKGLRNLVITAEMAEKLWGTAKVTGKTIEIKVQDKFEPFVVTGIIQNIPSNSSIAFQLLGNFNFLTTVTPDGRGQANDWKYSSSQTYIQLQNSGALNEVIKALPSFYSRHNTTNDRNYRFQPLRSIHTDTELKGAQVAAINPATIWILISIAGGILLISCINYTTLSIGRSVYRAREVGVRKVMGENRGSLRVQFMIESLLLTLIASILGLLILQVLLPWFNELSERQLQSAFTMFPQLIWLVAGVIAVIGLLSGIYPALILSSFNTIEVLKTKLRLSGSNFVTRSLVTFQFMLSAGLIISTIIMLQQLKFMESKNPGFNKENIVVVNAGGTWPRVIYPQFRQELISKTGIAGLSGSDQTFGASNYGNTEVQIDGLTRKVYEFYVEQDYLQVMSMQLVAGRDFNPAIGTDTLNSIIINETMMNVYGWTPENVIGQQIKGYKRNYDPIVIGVVKDFNFQPFSINIEPQLFHRKAKNRPYKYFVRIPPGDPAASLATVEAAWKKLAPDVPFRYSFLDEDLNRSYTAESRWGKIIGWAGGIAVVLASLGLLGLTALALANRAKEISIRKVLGASFTSIVTLVSKDFIKLIIAALALATPVSWYFMQHWLENFAYKISVSWWVFILAGAITILVALTTIGFSVIRAILANPVKNLKSD